MILHYKGKRMTTDLQQQSTSEESLITITPPVGILGALTALANTITSISDTIRAIAQDQSPEGRATAKLMLEALAIPLAIITKLNGLLKIDPLPAKSVVELPQTAPAGVVSDGGKIPPSAIPLDGVERILAPDNTIHIGTPWRAARALCRFDAGFTNWPARHYLRTASDPEVNCPACLKALRGSPAGATIPAAEVATDEPKFNT